MPNAERRRLPWWYVRGAKFIYIGAVVLMTAAYLIPITKVPMNPRIRDVERIAQPFVEAIRKFRQEHEGASPATLTELGEHPDPWGRRMLYDTLNPVFITSLGADGRTGGRGEDCDVHIWAGDK